MTTLDPLASFDKLAAEQPDNLTQQLREAGLPDAVLPRAHVDLSIALAALRRAMDEYNPRPAITDAEAPKFQAMLASLVEEATESVLSPYLARYAKVYQWAGGRLTDWNRERKTNKQEPTTDQRAMFANVPTPAMAGSAEDIDLGNGQHILRVHVTERQERRD